MRLLKSEVISHKMIWFLLFSVIIVNIINESFQYGCFCPENAHIRLLVLTVINVSAFLMDMNYTEISNISHTTYFLHLKYIFSKNMLKSLRREIVRKLFTYQRSFWSVWSLESVALISICLPIRSFQLKYYLNVFTFHLARI